MVRQRPSPSPSVGVGGELDQGTTAPRCPGRDRASTDQLNTNGRLADLSVVPGGVGTCLLVVFDELDPPRPSGRPCWAAGGGRYAGEPVRLLGGSVQARHTIARGAASRRTRAKPRTLSSIVEVLVFTSPSVVVLRCLGQGLQVLVEPVEAVGEEGAVGGCSGVHALAAELRSAGRAALRIAVLVDRPGPLQHLQVPRDVPQAEGVRRPSSLTVASPSASGQHRAPSGVGRAGEHRAQIVWRGT